MIFCWSWIFLNICELTVSYKGDWYEISVDLYFRDLKIWIVQELFLGLEYSWIFASSQFRTKGVGMRSMWIYVSSWESSDPNTWTPMLNKSGNFLLFPKLWSDIFPANILPSHSSYYHIIPFFVSVCDAFTFLWLSKLRACRDTVVLLFIVLFIP